MVCLSKQHDFSYEERVQEKTPYSPKFRYQRDPIGNRITSTTAESGSPVIRNYTSNNLNQYTAIDAPTQSPTYDDDGNCTSAALESGVWTFAWDANNQMKSSEKADQRLEYLYDSSGRRAMKKVFSGSVGSWSLNNDLRFVYDGYKLIEVLDGQNSNAIKQKITWNGETPFSIYDSALNQTYYYVLDANKNVSELIDASGNIVAHYEYSPFGKIVSQSGTYADENPIRFSSEYFDVETGLVYYNFRYYSPELGRWMSRDPIEEEGGYNLYAMLKNNTPNNFDSLGLGIFTPEHIDNFTEPSWYSTSELEGQPCSKKECENKGTIKSGPTVTGRVGYGSYFTGAIIALGNPMYGPANIGAVAISKRRYVTLSLDVKLQGEYRELKWLWKTCYRRKLPLFWKAEAGYIDKQNVNPLSLTMDAFFDCVLLSVRVSWLSCECVGEGKCIWQKKETLTHSGVTGISRFYPWEPWKLESTEGK